MRGTGLRRFGWGVVGLLACGLAGCDGFFVKPNSTGTTTVTNGDYVYVSNASTGTAIVNGYNLSSGSFNAASSSPYTFSFIPVSMKVSAQNGFLYAATNAATNAGYSGIYAYTIGTGGALTSVTSGNNGSNLMISGSPVWIDISADGNWLAELDGASQVVNIYSINTSTAVLTLLNPVSLVGAGTLSTYSPQRVRFAPSGNWIVATLGTSGTAIIPFNTSSGANSAASYLTPSGTGIGDFAAAFDASDDLFIARTGVIASYTLSASAQTVTFRGTISVGSGPRSLIVDNSNKYVYSVNQNDGTVSQETIGSNAALTQIAGAITGPATPYQLTTENSSKYVVVGGCGSSGLQLFTIGSLGALTSSTTAMTGTPTVCNTVIAATH